MGSLTTTLALDAGEVFDRHVVVRIASTKSMDDAVAQCQKKIEYFQKNKPGAYFIERSSVAGTKPLHTPEERTFLYRDYFTGKEYTRTYKVHTETTYLARVVQLTPVED